MILKAKHSNPPLFLSKLASLQYKYIYFSNNFSIYTPAGFIDVSIVTGLSPINYILICVCLYFIWKIKL